MSILSPLSSTRRKVYRWLLVSLLVCCCRRAEAEAGLPQTINAHRNLVRWTGFLPDGRSLATASFDGSLRIYDAASGELRTTLAGHHGQVFWGSVSEDGRVFASGGDDAGIRLWELETGRIRTELRGHRGIAWTGRVTPDGKRIVSGGPDAMVFVWSTAADNAERSFRHSAPVWWIDVSPDSRTAAVASGDGQVTLYDIETGAPRRTFGAHAGGVYCVAFSHDGQFIATVGADSQSMIWKTQDGSLLHALPQFGAVHAVAFSPDDGLLATGGADYCVRLWSVGEGVFCAKHTGHSDAVWTVAFSPSGRQIASSGGDGVVFLWDTVQPESRSPALKSHVDLRPEFRQRGLRIVPQRSRNTCSVHTFTRALEFALSKSENRGVRLSDEYLNWACNQVIGNTGASAVDRGQFFEHLWMGYCKHGICAAASMPFRQTFDPALAPTAAAVQSAQAIGRHRFVWHDITGRGVTDVSVVSEAKRVLSNGLPLLAGSAHSLLVVGYVDEPGGGYFVVADSGTGGFIDRVTADPLHSAIPYARVKDYGFSWIECHPAPRTAL